MEDIEDVIRTTIEAHLPQMAISVLENNELRARLEKYRKDERAVFDALPEDQKAKILLDGEIADLRHRLQLAQDALNGVDLVRADEIDY
jgi:hypothetical protein